MSKFLILRFSSIGDIVLTTPVIRCLKQQVKDAEVHYATKKSFSPVIEHNPYIDKRIYLEDDLSALIHQLQKEKYDYVIDLHHNLRTAAIKLRLGVKSYAFNKINFEKWLMVNFKMDSLPRVHIVDRYMETLKSVPTKSGQVGVTNDGQGLDYFLSQDDEKAIEKIPATHRAGYIGFVIGAKHVTKKLPVEKIISICKKINQPIVLLGGKEDFETGETIVRESQIANRTSQIFNATGKFSLNESAALVKHASKIITHDTGLMHIAAAFKKDIISVWGNTVPKFGMLPYKSGVGSSGFGDKIVEVKNLPCRPCTKLGFEKCPKGHFKCMREIDEEKILQSL